MAGMPADEFFREVSNYFKDDETPENTVILNSNGRGDIDYLLRVQSPVLRMKTSRDAEFCVINCSEDTWSDLLDLHREQTIPEDLQALYRLLAVTETLQLKKLSLRCLRALFKNNRFWQEDYPRECPKEAVLGCLRALLRTPFRADDFIREHLARVNRYCDGLGLRVLDTFKTEFDSYEELGLERLPVRFNERRAHVVIAYDPKRAIGLESGIFHDGEFKRVNVFGKNFNLTVDKKIEAFHVKWSSYILYLHDGTVYRQDVREAEAEKIIENCTYFISREHDVLIITKEGSKHRILHWVEDRGSFEIIYCTSAEISSIDFYADRKALLIVERLGSVLVFRFENESLELQDKYVVCGSPDRLLFALFHQDYVVVAIDRAGVTDILAYDSVILRETVNRQTLLTEFENQEFRTFCSSGGLFSSCGRILRRAPTLMGELFMYDEGTEKPMLGSLLHLCSSELCLLP